MLDRANKCSRSASPGGFNLQQVALTHGQAESQDERGEQCTQRARGLRKTAAVLAGENTGQARVLRWARRKGLQGDRVSFIQGGFMD